MEAESPSALTGSTGGMSCGDHSCIAGSTTSQPSSPGREQDHPRICGEHDLGHLTDDGMAGSPPHMQGVRRSVSSQVPTLGSPQRTRGALVVRWHRLRTAGSSPRMRGAPRLCRSAGECPGITSAYAGSTGRLSGLTSCGRDHPRVCGEHSSTRIPAVRSPGSPPRMRGARPDPPVLGAVLGITPAYAGSTTPPVTSSSASRDHPCVCGAHGGAVRHGVLLLGITPAYAGSTGLHVLVTPGLWDHPRVCGEHLAYRLTKYVCPGSPPRMRGARPGVVQGALRQGITPAYAGSTRARWRSAAGRTDHPRVCGEHVTLALPPRAPTGSPPPMRGALGRLHPVPHRRRITPAYAGSTRGPGGSGRACGDHPRVCGEHW